MKYLIVITLLIAFHWPKLDSVEVNPFSIESLKEQGYGGDVVKANIIYIYKVGLFTFPVSKKAEFITNELDLIYGEGKVLYNFQYVESGDFQKEIK